MAQPLDWPVTRWAFGITFLVLSILNLIFVGTMQGGFYLALALLLAYFPRLNAALQKRVDLTIPPVVLLLEGIAISWGTLGVGDLMEVYEASRRARH